MFTGIFYGKKFDKFVRGSAGPGGFSFYRTKDLGKKGTRIKFRSTTDQDRNFETQAQAEKAMFIFAKKKGLSPMSYEQIVQLNRSRLIGSTTLPPFA